MSGLSGMPVMLAMLDGCLARLARLACHMIPGSVLTEHNLADPSNRLVLRQLVTFELMQKHYI